MNRNNVEIVVCLTSRPGIQEYREIEKALSGIRGVRGITLNNHVTRLVNVNYNPAVTNARTILDGVVRTGDRSARLVGM